MYKVYRGILPEIWKDLFLLRKRDQYNLRNRSRLIIPNVNIVHHGSENLKYLGLKIWEVAYQGLMRDYNTISKRNRFFKDF